MIVMAQELVLIPKEEYESLLAQQKNTPAHKTTEHPQEHQTTEQDETADAKYPIQHKEAQLKEPANKRKDIAQEPPPEMKGAGKKYVRQSIEKFLKLTTRSKRNKRQTKDSKWRRNLIKQKWIHY